VCTLVAVDIVGFTKPERDDATRLHLHEVLYRILEQAFDASGIPWAGCFVEDRGDGALIVIPPTFGARATVDPLPERLRILIGRHNHVSSDGARIQLRVAVHAGPVDHDGYGFIGSDVNFLFRMLNARSLSAALVDSDADVACIVSEDIYRNTVCRFPGMVSPDDFRRTRFQVKHTKGRALIYVPGRLRRLTPPRDDAA
jgi:class 3 adenylate cyclase